MSKKNSNSRNLSGIVFKTVDSRDLTSRRYSDDYSYRANTNYSARGKLTAESNPILETSLLNIIRHRKSTSINTEINSETISTVVKDYVLPMFTYDFRSKAKNKRHNDYGLKKKNENTLEKAEGSVFSELKLSQQLGNENKNLRKQLDDLQVKMNDLTFEKITLEKEANYANEKINSLETFIKYLIFTTDSIKKASNFYEQNFNFIKDKYNRYKKLHNDLLKKNNELSAKLHEERAKNDIRLFLLYFFN